MGKIANYDGAIKEIKDAILKSQLDAIKSVNEKQLLLYFAIGKYISLNSRNGFWGEGAIDVISERLQKELPGLRGFSARNLKNMRSFFESWSNLADASAEINSTNLPAIWQARLPNYDNLSYEAFVSVGFSHHTLIIWKAKDIDERIYYINKCAYEHLSYRELSTIIDNDAYHHSGRLTNNFISTISDSSNAFKAINTFKDEYLLDFINVEELDVRDKQDVDEKVLEKQIINNVKNFILTFGSGFAFIRNQYHLDAFGEDQYIDLLFFNRELNCLVAVELKTGKFKTSYLGQLSGYLSVLDEFERKQHENPSIGIILCKDMNKSFVDFVIRDYSKPMGVATYKTSKDMSSSLKKSLPDIDKLKELINND